MGAALSINPAEAPNVSKESLKDPLQKLVEVWKKLPEDVQEDVIDRLGYLNITLRRGSGKGGTRTQDPQKTIESIKTINLRNEIQTKIVRVDPQTLFTPQWWTLDLSSLVGFYKTLAHLDGKDPVTRASRRMLLVVIGRLRQAFPRQDENWRVLMRHISQGHAGSEDENEVDKHFQEWARAGQRYDSFIGRLGKNPDILLLLPWEIADSTWELHWPLKQHDQVAEALRARNILETTKQCRGVTKVILKGFMSKMAEQCRKVLPGIRVDLTHDGTGFRVWMDKPRPDDHNSGSASSRPTKRRKTRQESQAQKFPSQSTTTELPRAQVGPRNTVENHSNPLDPIDPAAEHQHVGVLTPDSADSQSLADGIIVEARNSAGTNPIDMLLVAAHESSSYLGFMPRHQAQAAETGSVEAPRSQSTANDLPCAGLGPVHSAVNNYSTSLGYPIEPTGHQPHTVGSGQARITTPIDRSTGSIEFIQLPDINGGTHSSPGDVQGAVFNIGGNPSAMLVPPRQRREQLEMVWEGRPEGVAFWFNDDEPRLFTE